MGALAAVGSDLYRAAMCGRLVALTRLVTLVLVGTLVALPLRAQPRPDEPSPHAPPAAAPGPPAAPRAATGESPDAQPGAADDTPPGEPTVPPGSDEPPVDGDTEPPGAAAPAATDAPGSPAEGAPNAAVPTPTVRPGGADSQGSRCEPDWFTRVYARTHRSVVRIETGGGLGAGFAFHSPQHIATAYHVVSLGRAIEVTLPDGTVVGAQVVATDPENDLALLELERPAGQLRPLPAGPADRVPLGAPVIVIGHPYALDTSGRQEGLLNWSVSQGIISGRGTHQLQTDAAVNPGNSGGPLIDCEGRVLGVVSAKLFAEGIGFVIPIDRVDQLTEQIGKAEPELDAWQLSLTAALAIHASPDEALVGFGAGLSTVLYDRWVAALRVGALWGSTKEEAAPYVLDRSLSRVMFELDLEHRWLVMTRPFPLYLGLGVGGAVGHSAWTERTVSAALSPDGCAGSSCAIQISIDEHEDDEWMGWPAAQLHAQLFGVMDVSYGFLPDVRDFSTSLHRILLGLSF